MDLAEHAARGEEGARTRRALPLEVLASLVLLRLCLPHSFAPHSRYRDGAQGIALRTIAFMINLIKLLLLATTVVGSGVWIWRTTDPDPKRYRASLSPQEIQTSWKRAPWVIAELACLAKAAGLRSSLSFGIANAGAHYSPFWHRVSISRAFLARLSDTDLRLILAHEVAHAARRLQTFSRCGAIEEELAADRAALQMTGSTPEQWAEAIRASVVAEPGMAITNQLALRAEALGIQLEEP